MSIRIAVALALVGLLSRGALGADEPARQVAKQKQAAQASWETLELPKPAFHESRLLLIYGELPVAQLRAVVPELERQYLTAYKALHFEVKESPWPGKLTVYLFRDRRHFASFLRLVEKRRPQEDDQGGFEVRGDTPHVVAGPPMRQGDPSIQAEAAEEIAAALLARKARTDLPDWLLSGFGRATAWRAGSPTASTQRSLAYRLVLMNRRSAQDVWSGSLKADEAPLVQASLMDYLAYGPGASRFVSFVQGFRPEDGKPQKTAADALKAADLAPDRLNQAWQVWLRRPR